MRITTGIQVMRCCDICGEHRPTSELICPPYPGAPGKTASGAFAAVIEEAWHRLTVRECRDGCGIA